jgi:hypothetical protein
MTTLGATRGDDIPWTAVEYGKVLQQLQRWMAGVHRWNAIFLLLVGLFFEEKMWETFAMSGGCTWLRGVWIFQPKTVPSSGQDLRYDGQVERAVQAIGGVAIVMEHLVGSRIVDNLRNGSKKLPLAFTDMWNEDKMPQDVDRLERSPTELQRMVQAYLPERWGLVAFGITTSILDIVQQGFVGSQFIVLDGSPARTRFLYNALRHVFTTDMQVICSIGMGRTAGPSIGGSMISRKRPPSHIVQYIDKEEVHDEAMEEPEEEVDDEAVEASEDENSESDHDGDGEEQVGKVCTFKIHHEEEENFGTRQMTRMMSPMIQTNHQMQRNWSCHHKRRRRKVLILRRFCSWAMRTRAGR